MAIYNITLSPQKYPGLQYRAVITETVNYVNNASDLTIDIQYRNTTDDTAYYVFVDHEISVNGTLITSETNPKRPTLGGVTDWTSLITKTTRCAHEADGSGSAAISITVNEKKTALIGGFDCTGSISPTVVLTSIDVLKPTISAISYQRDRYGKNLLISFTAAHTTYNLSKIAVTVSGLTDAQSLSRVNNKMVGAEYTVQRVGLSNGLYDVIYTCTGGLGLSKAVSLDLDSYNDAQPLNSGQSYPCEVEVVCSSTNKSTLQTGTIVIPQKVEGITADSYLNVVLNQTAQIYYAVTPSNAELKTVTFSSSDTSKVTVSDSGLVTGVALGTATVTLTTNDGGYIDTVEVEVTETEVFPLTDETVTALTVPLCEKIMVAQKLIRSKLMAEEITVGELDELNATRDMSPFQIMSVFVKIEANCSTLKTAASSVYSATHLDEDTVIATLNTGESWFYLINECIALLVELNEAF